MRRQQPDEPDPRHWTDGQGPEVVARISGLRAYGEAVCSLTRTSRYLAVLLVTPCSVDININMDIAVSWDIGTERYGLLDSLS